MSDSPLTHPRSDLSRHSLRRSGSDASPWQAPAQQHSPDAEPAFREALDRGPEADDPTGIEAHAQALAQPHDIFALLGGRSASPQAAVPRPPADLLGSLQDLARQMMLSDAPAGQQRLRLQLDEERLPGASVTVGEEAGACLAEFECSVESSFLCLAGPARDLARQLAEALRRDAVWRVRACGALTASPGTWRSLSEEIEGGLGVEAYAPAPRGGPL
jgi:hypothetical protein